MDIEDIGARRGGEGHRWNDAHGIAASRQEATIQLHDHSPDPQSTISRSS
jgi:hypothetical protein